MDYTITIEDDIMFIQDVINDKIYYGNKNEVSAEQLGAQQVYKFKGLRGSGKNINIPVDQLMDRNGVAYTMDSFYNDFSDFIDEKKVRENLNSIILIDEITGNKVKYTSRNGLLVAQETL